MEHSPYKKEQLELVKGDLKPKKVENAFYIEKGRGEGPKQEQAIESSNMQD